MTSNYLEYACEKIEAEKEYLNNISQDIWAHPELNFEEHFAHDLLTSALSKYGFEVTKNYFLPTAFKAEFCSKQGKGPTIGILLEYDALPIIGHGCGHNLIAEAGLAAGIGVKAAMEKDSTLIGKIILLGTPTEEGGGGKIKLINKGVFQNIDAAMMVHPQRHSNLYAPPTLTILRCSVEFKGKESHASLTPWEGLNALDAAVTVYQSMGLLRQQIKPSCKLHAIITKGGATLNVIPAETQLKISLRATTMRELNELKAKVDNCIIGAAISTGCSYERKYDEENCYESLLSNPILTKLFGQFATKLGLEEDTIKVEVNSTASTDMGNVSQVVPSIHPLYGIKTDGANHTKEFAEASGSLDAQAPTLAAAKAMAMTVLTLFKNPDILADMKAQFEVDQNS